MSSTAVRASNAHEPIGVFDSGVGGLTVLRALLRTLPHEDFLYLGDTARLPYGTKSPASIRRYALQAAALLRERGVKCLVVACNTASAVALAEEGWTDGPVVEAVIHRYLDDLCGSAAPDRPDTLVLGCTHFPGLVPAIRRVLGNAVAIVDSTETTATALAGVLERAGLRRPPAGADGTIRLLATDSAERFARVGGTFLGRPLRPADVEVVDL